MQDIRSIGSDGGVRLVGDGGGDRRLRPHNNHRQQQGNGPPALKCPRCESLNTKFCYYNNYNLSQPRHFCKSCRRYWTNGGVLRNVPVGGGCRKKKRSKHKSSNKSRPSNAGVRKPSKFQNSSSESSSLTANTTAANTTVKTTTTVPVTTAEVLSGMNSTEFLNIRHSSAPNPSFDPPLLEHSFAEIDTLTGLISSPAAHLGFNMSGGISPFRLHHPGDIAGNSNAEQQWMLTDHAIGDDLKAGDTSPLRFMDAHTPPTEFSGLPEKAIDGGLGTEDWNNCTDEALFDLTGTVDQSYWNQTQWDE